MSEYNQGGQIFGGPVLAWLDADECLISREDVMAGRWVCSRPGHPTPTSDCTTGRNGMSRTNGTT